MTQTNFSEDWALSSFPAEACESLTPPHPFTLLFFLCYLQSLYMEIIRYNKNLVQFSPWRRDITKQVTRINREGNYSAAFLDTILVSLCYFIS
jgi:hypothetical protein